MIFFSGRLSFSLISFVTHTTLCGRFVVINILHTAEIFRRDFQITSHNQQFAFNRTNIHQVESIQLWIFLFRGIMLSKANARCWDILMKSWTANKYEAVEQRLRKFSSSSSLRQRATSHSICIFFVSERGADGMRRNKKYYQNVSILLNLSVHTQKSE